MNPQLFLAFLLVAVALACTPGVDWAYSIAAGLRQRSFLPAIAGLCSGYVVHTLLMAAGLAALLAGVPGLLGWLTIAGAAYLIWFGWLTLRSWRGASFAAAEQAVGASGEGISHAQQGNSRATPAAAASQVAAFLQGMGTSGINPKGLLFFLALVPQFVSPEAPLPVPVQSGVLGLTFVALAAAVYTAVALGSRKLLGSRPAAARAVTLASGTIMLLLGTVLLAEQLLPLMHV